MTKPSSPQYGHAHCPICRKDFALADAKHRFSVRGGSDALIFLFCNGCGPNFFRIRRKQQLFFLRLCLEKEMERFNNGEAKTVAIVTHSSLIQNNYDVVRAYEIGSSLPRHVHDQLFAGTADLTQIGDVTIVCSHGEDES
jgi:hypothetical protein